MARFGGGEGACWWWCWQKVSKIMGCLDGSVSWVSDSRFRLRSWSQGVGSNPVSGSALSVGLLKILSPNAPLCHLCSLKKRVSKIIMIPLWTIIMIKIMQLKNVRFVSRIGDSKGKKKGPLWVWYSVCIPSPYLFFFSFRFTVPNLPNAELHRGQQE